MSKLLILSVLSLTAVASCGRLEPQYLPPRAGSYSAAASGYSSASASASASAYSSASASFRFDNQNNGDGTYRYSYDTPNGISAHESGAPRASGPEGPAVTADGGFSYRAPDGQQISLTYTADENGFHPSGAHLPTPPPIPDAILRSIEFNRRNLSGDGSYNGGSNGYRY